jgi:hypothetical protein
MSEQPPGSSPDDQSAADSTSEPTSESGSPFARPPGYESNVGYERAPIPEEPRFAGAPFNPDAGTEYGSPEYGSPQYGYPPPGDWGAPFDSPYEPSPPPRKKPWIIVTVLVLALVAGGTTVGLVSSGGGSNGDTATPFPQITLNPPSTSPAPNTSPVPNTSPAPGTGPTPSVTPDPNSSLPLPNTGVATPPGLLAIGYHAYSLRLRDPDELSLGPGEDAQFTKYGLSRIVGLRALTLGKSGTGDDYDADISILRFRDAAGAKAELAYSNAENKKDRNAKVIALPGFPGVTAFLNSDETDGVSVGAFTTIGRYQIVLFLGGLIPNVPTDSKAVAAETARVLKALLPDAADIEPEATGGGGAPTLPTPTPSGVRA